MKRDVRGGLEVTVIPELHLDSVTGARVKRRYARGADRNPMGAFANFHRIPVNVLLPAGKLKFRRESAGFFVQLHHVARRVYADVTGTLRIVSLILVIEKWEAAVDRRIVAIVPQLSAACLRTSFILDGRGTLQIEHRPDFAAETPVPFETRKRLKGLIPGLSVPADLPPDGTISLKRDLGLESIEIAPSRRFSRVLYLFTISSAMKLGILAEYSKLIRRACSNSALPGPLRPLPALGMGNRGRSSRFSPSRKGMPARIPVSFPDEGRSKSRIAVTSRYWYRDVLFSQTGWIVLQEISTWSPILY